MVLHAGASSDSGGDRQAGQHLNLSVKAYEAWRDVSEYLYACLLYRESPWPSLCVEWLPGVEAQGPHLSQHTLLLGTQTSGKEPNALWFIRAGLPECDAEQSAGEGVVQPSWEVVQVRPSSGPARLLR